MAKKILITGASGFVGGGLWRYFTDVGFLVTASGRKENLSANYVRADLAESPDVAKSLLGSAPFDYVLHCAGVKDVRWCETHPEEAERINATASGWLAKACASAGSKFAYLSTDLVFPAERGGYLETELPASSIVYGETKAKGEELSLAAASDALVCRTGGVFGAGSPLFKWLKGELTAKKQVDAFVDVKNTPTFIPDLGKMLELLFSGNHSGVFHCCGGESVSRFEWFKEYAEAKKLDGHLIREAKAAGKYRDLMLFPDSSLKSQKTFQATGFVPTKLSKAFTEIL